MRKTFYFLLSCLLIGQITFASSLPDISADGAYLIETNTNTIIYSKNGEMTFYPASTTKVLTSLAIAQDLPMNQVITKSQTAVNEVPSDSSQIGLNVGAQYSVYDGLHAVLMSSDNFVCYDLALADSGSIPAFANEMNALAASANATNFNFMNPHGYHDINHYVTPSALARITIAAFNNPIVSEIAGTYSYNFTVLNSGQTIPLKHTSALLNPDSPYYNKHVTASKTGYHTPAGRTLVAKANYGDMDFVGVVMRTDAPLQFQDMNKLFTYGSENFILTTDENGNNVLENRSYSSWAEPYVKEALSNEWITNSTYNYTRPITHLEFLTLLSRMTSDHHIETINQMIDESKNSLYTLSAPTTRVNIATAIFKYLSFLDLSKLPLDSKIVDIASLSTSKQDAINFCVQSNLLSLHEGNLFAPNGMVTYEEAICIVSKLNGLINRYNNFVF